MFIVEVWMLLKLWASHPKMIDKYIGFFKVGDLSREDIDD